MNPNVDKYMVTASGQKNGTPYTTLTRIVSGTKKDSTDTYSFLDTTRTIRENEVMALGTIVDYRTSRVATPTPAPAAHRAATN